VTWLPWRAAMVHISTKWLPVPLLMRWHIVSWLSLWHARGCASALSPVPCSDGSACDIDVLSSVRQPLPPARVLCQVLLRFWAVVLKSRRLRMADLCSLLVRGVSCWVMTRSRVPSIRTWLFIPVDLCVAAVFAAATLSIAQLIFDTGPSVRISRLHTGAARSCW
jgi:hypothetical protein